MKLLAYALGATALVTLACGGGSAAPAPTAPAPTPTVAVDTTARFISDEELATMTLAQPELGPGYEAFVLQDGSGALSVTGRSLLACNPTKEAQALNTYAWERSYQRYFESPDQGWETLLIGSHVDVYQDTPRATDKLRYDRAAIDEDTRSDRGCNGLVIEGVDDFAVAGLGDDAWGVKERFAISGVRGSVTTVSFRHGRVVTTVTVARLSFDDASAEVIALAELLDQRIEGLLRPPLS
jgi:hypothetical protein